MHFNKAAVLLLTCVVIKHTHLFPSVQYGNHKRNTLLNLQKGNKCDVENHPKQSSRIEYVESAERKLASVTQSTMTVTSERC